VIEDHHVVVHPQTLITARRSIHKEAHPWLHRNDMFLQWVTDHVLASIAMFDVALVLPLLVLPAPEWVKFVLIVVSSNWVQWWALPALQRSQNSLQRRQEAKAEVDHQTLTYLATIQDEQIEILRRLDTMR
jgi:hypothetical protein